MLLLNATTPAGQRAEDLDPVCEGRLRRRDGLTGGVLAAFQTVWLSWGLRCGRLKTVRWLAITGRARG